jgi:integrase
MELTTKRINEAQTDKQQAFVWDTLKGFGLRVTKGGAKAFIYQTRIDGKDVRFTIGAADKWRLPEARKRAMALKVDIDNGRDPRKDKAAATAARQAQAAHEQITNQTIGAMFPTYLEKGAPKRKTAFKPVYLAHMTAMASPGGEPKVRGRGLTVKGALFDLLQVRVCDLNEDVIRVWFEGEMRKRPGQAVKALRIFQGYLRWYSQQDKALKPLISMVREAATDEGIKDLIPARNIRTDHLPEKVVGRWLNALDGFDHVQATYLMGLLMLGCRREELTGLKWLDIKAVTGTMVIKDKVKLTREIPAGDHFLAVITTLPRINEFVFASTRTKTGHIDAPRVALNRSSAAVGVEHITFHGLRRSFAKLAESAGAPTGAVAQIMGHSTKSIIEGYKPRDAAEMVTVMNQIQAHILALGAEA